MINIKNLCFTYDKTSPLLLEDVNLEIPKGVYLSIVGENGSCKTTLIKLILGLLSPVSGSINLHTDNIAYVPQKVESFNSQFPISVYEVLKTHGKAMKLKDNSPILRSLEQVNMLSFKNNLIGSLSGGQQQRVFIGRALMGNPDLIVLDEPSSGVDNKNQLEIYSLLKKINEKNGTTIISIEHNMDTALKYSSHILQIKDGKTYLFENNEFRKYINLESQGKLSGF